MRMTSHQVLCWMLLPVIGGILLLLGACKGSSERPVRVFFSGETLGRLAACICDGQLAGGMAFRRGFLHQQRGDYLLLDTGNVACGSEPEALVRARQVLEDMRALGYQALNVGEAEAALGLPGIATLAAVGVPLVSSNLQAPAASWSPLLTLQVDGRQIQVCGVVDPARVARPDLRAEAPREALARLLPELTAHLCVLLVDGRLSLARALAEEFPEFQLILCRGHGESIGPERHNRSIIASVYGNRYIGAVQLTSQPGQLPQATGQPSELTADYAADEPTVDAPAGISVTPAELDFGSFEPGTTRQAALTVRNETAGPVRIGRVYSPCSCFAMDLDERAIAPGAAVTITVTLHTLDLEGQSRFPLFVAIEGTVSGMLSVQATAQQRPAAAP